VRLAALAALARMGTLERAAIDRVIACMQTDADDGVRRAAAATVKRIAERDAHAAEALVRVTAEATDAEAGAGQGHKRRES
jgi:hypothetical protein